MKALALGFVLSSAMGVGFFARAEAPVSQPIPFERGWQIVGGTINASVGPNCTASLSYPVLLDPSNSTDPNDKSDVARLSINKQIRELIDGQFAEYEELSGYAGECVREGLSSLDYDLEWKMTYHDANLVSLKFDGYQYTGGAHGNESLRGATFDLDTGAAYALSDFLLQPAQSVIVAQMIASLSASNQYQEDWFNEWSATVKTIDGLGAFYVGADGLTIRVDQYQVGPYVNGPADILVPWAELRSNLKPGTAFSKF